MYNPLTIGELGQIFISHSSEDKPFVRRLAKVLEYHGFKVWLDEKDLLIGDGLTKSISQAIQRAKVIIIVISKAALVSGWVNFELMHAATRMIQGNCRLVPVVLDDVEPPVELNGLLYERHPSTYRGGFKRILRTLSHEKIRVAGEAVTISSDESWVRSRAIDRAITQTFHANGYCSLEIDSYQTVDFNSAEVSLPDGKKYSVAWDSKLRYIQHSSLTLREWNDWSTYVKDILQESSGMLITERPPESTLVDELDNYGQGIFGEVVRGGLLFKGLVALLIDISNVADDSQLLRRIKEAHDVFCSLVV